jgi:hypothetical protein
MTFPEEPKPDLPSSPPFLSGTWEGYFVQSVGGGLLLGWMELELHFVGGEVIGRGVDLVGRFRVTGKYQAESARCVFRKRYLGAHGVFYSGSGDASGIRGKWRIAKLGSGAFHIWPCREARPPV